jgi:hypothetical protein
MVSNSQESSSPSIHKLHPNHPFYFNPKSNSSLSFFTQPAANPITFFFHFLLLPPPSSFILSHRSSSQNLSFLSLPSSVTVRTPISLLSSLAGSRFRCRPHLVVSQFRCRSRLAVCRSRSTVSRSSPSSSPQHKSSRLRSLPLSFSLSSKFERVEGSARSTRLGNAPLTVPSLIPSVQPASSSRS